MWRWAATVFLAVVLTAAGALGAGSAEVGLLERYHRASSIGPRGYGEPEAWPQVAPPGVKTYRGSPRRDFTPAQPRLTGLEGLPALLAAFRRAAVPLAEARRRWLGGVVTAQVLSRAAVGRVLFAGSGVTRAERFSGRAFYFRSAPSAGALYPVESYLVAARVEGLEPGLYHYDPLRHELEAVKAGAVWSQVQAALPRPEQRRRPAAYLVLTGVFDRTRFKYNVRGYRYVLLDAGHVAANLALEGAAAGLGVRLLPHFNDQALNRTLGVDGLQEAALLVVALQTAAGPEQAETEGGKAEEAPSAPTGPATGPPPGPLSLRVHAETGLDAGELAALRAPGAPAEEPPAEAARAALAEPAQPRGTLEEALASRRSRRRFGRGRLSGEELSALLGWWAEGAEVPGLRFYVVVQRAEGVEPGVYRYWPASRGLQRVAPAPRRGELSAAALGQGWLAEAAGVMVPVAEAEQLGGPAGGRWYRDVHLAAGEAGGRLYLAAEGLGLGTCAVGALRDREVARLLGLAEGLWPLMLYPVGRR